MILKSIFSLIICLTANLVFSQTTLVPVKPAGQAFWGYSTLEGDLVIPADMKKVNVFNEGYTPVLKSNGDWAFINTKGESLNVEAGSFAAVSIFGFGIKGFNDGLAPIIVKKKKGVINKEGKTIHNPEYNYISDFNGGFAAAKIAKQFYILTEDGKRLEIDKPIIDLKKFSEGLAPYRGKSKLWGFMNSSGQVEIEAKFMSVGYFSHGLAWAKASDNLIGIINKKGEWVVKPQYLSAKEYDASGYARVKSGTEWRFLTKEGDEITVSGNLSLGDFNEGLAYARKGDFYGFVNTQGDWVVDAKYAKVKDFTEGYAAVRNGASWGFIDKSGKEVISPKF
ncbi:MAG: WG repeat-containing protein, partial [Crocinitomicaceae bacterium]|nr:WG repeat-containing protein [Crocinitomicaceae bacterium]